YRVTKTSRRSPDDRGASLRSPPRGSDWGPPRFARGRESRAPRKSMPPRQTSAGTRGSDFRDGPSSFLSLFLHLESAQIVPAIACAAGDGEANRRRPGVWIYKRNADVIGAGRQVKRYVHGFVNYRIARQPVSHVGGDVKNGLRARGPQLHGQPVIAIYRGDTGVIPPHLDRHHRAGSDLARVLQPAQDQPVTHLFLELLKLRLPLLRN